MFMGPIVDSKIKPPDVSIPMLQIESNIKTVEHNSSYE